MPELHKNDAAYSTEEIGWTGIIITKGHTLLEKFFCVFDAWQQKNCTVLKNNPKSLIL